MKVCLCMIVKDEAAVITRCLKSVRPWIDAWCVVDTGSTDATRELVVSTLRELPGELHNRPWRNFGHNRTEALMLARELCCKTSHADDVWLLLIDADEEFTAPSGWHWPETLAAHAYQIQVKPDGTDMLFTRHLLLKADQPWRFEGRIHEDIARDCEEPWHRGGVLNGPLVITRRDGARQKNPRKYLDDAELVKQEMSRNAFYLAQSYFDDWATRREQASLEEALRRYEDRAQMPGWDQETWQAVFKVAQCKELLGRPPREVIEAYLAAYAFRPARAESLSALADFCRRIGQPVVADLFADRAREMRPNGDSMYVRTDSYGAPDVRIGIITAPRTGGSTLGPTLTSVIASDRSVWPGMLRVFADMTQSEFVAANPGSAVPVAVSCEAEDELQRRREAGGIFGSLNLARALQWAGGARDVAVTLEDDVLCSREWLARGISLLEAAERNGETEVVISLHDMHPREKLGAEVVTVGDDALLEPTRETFPNGSQGYLMRPETARALAASLRAAMERDDRREWAMDVGMMRLCKRMLFASPCLLLHQDGACSTWAAGPEGIFETDAEHRECRRTRRWRPW